MDRSIFETLRQNPFQFLASQNAVKLYIEGELASPSTGFLHCPPQLVHCATLRSAVDCSQWPAGPVQLKLRPDGAPRDGDARVQYLPWVHGTICWTQMHPDAELFITPTVVTCGIFVAGPRTAPIVFHANFGVDDGWNDADTKSFLDILVSANLPDVAECELQPIVAVHDFDLTVFAIHETDGWQFYKQRVEGSSAQIERF